ncbi:MAG: SatD family protein [Candidatus Eisenbacteria bacterium]
METRGETRAGAYVALIGDIRKSRHIAERDLLQQQLEKALGTANERFAADVAAGFVLTLGDEFQGLLLRPSTVVDVLIALDEALEGAEVRYGIGWGGLSTELKDVALRTDGPCFHRARAALTAGKRDDRWVTAAGFGSDDEVLNGLFWLVGAVRWQWTDIQRQTVRMMRTAGAQRQVAQSRGVSVNAVSKALKSALQEPVHAAERAAAEILARYDDRIPDADDSKRGIT